MSEILLKMSNISKVFPGVRALSEVSFTLRKGEIHAICGENGAGKTTLLKILNGTYISYEGDIFLEGKKVSFNSTRDARLKGISIIPQEIELANDLSVAENIYMGEYPGNKLGFVDWKKMNDNTLLLQEKLNSKSKLFNPSSKISSLSIGQKQLVEILKAISFNIKILALDEPSSSLSEKETKQLFQLMKNFTESGVSLIYVSHRLNEIFDVCDRISVLKDGKLVGTKNIKDTDMGEVINMMVGRNFEIYSEREFQDKKNNEVVFEIKNFSKKGNFENISFSLRKGEILGIFGILGSGRSEVVRTVFGIDRKTSGEVFINGIRTKIDNPGDAVKNKIGFVTEDRHGQGLILQAMIRWNITLPFIKKLAKLNFIRKADEKSVSIEYIKKLKIKANSDEFKVENLSGGNQQKVVISKWLASKSDIIIFDEPTRGIDVGTKAEIYNLIKSLAREGHSIIMISSELPEILGLSDRILVFKDGKISAEIEASNTTTESDILKYAI